MNIVAFVDVYHSELSDTGSGTSEPDASGSCNNIQTATVPSGCWESLETQAGPVCYDHRYTFDRVGNRLSRWQYQRQGVVASATRETMTYNGLNQLVEKQVYQNFAADAERVWEYAYDMNGNLTSATSTNAALAVTERWRYEWNPRDQLTRAEKYTGPGSGDFAGAVEYSWCLSCDSALSERREYNAAGECISWQRYEYDGLQLLRRDERYDADADGLPYLDSNGVPDSGD